MDIQNLVREQIIGHIKTGKKGENGLPQKLPYFNVEEDKATSAEYVEIFKKLYPNKPTKLKIRFTSENPFMFKYKRYVNGKPVCIGNDVKAITVGKDEKGRNAQIEIECGETCEQRTNGRCKLVGSLKFVLDGIDAGGLWRLNTSGGFSLSNIATEIIKYKKAGMSIVGVPFELSLVPQESLAYGTYYSVELKRTDVKPQLTEVNESVIPNADIKALDKPEEKKIQEKEVSLDEKEKKDNTITKTENSKSKTTTTKNKKENEEKATDVEIKKEENDNSNYLALSKFMPTLISGKKFDKIIFQDVNSQDIEYVLHPKADQEILKCDVGTIIELVSSTMEMNHNILCKYNIVQKVLADNVAKEKSEELKKAV